MSKYFAAPSPYGTVTVEGVELQHTTGGTRAGDPGKGDGAYYHVRENGRHLAYVTTLAEIDRYVDHRTLRPVEKILRESLTSRP
jgi:hypothetical protein